MPPKETKTDVAVPAAEYVKAAVTHDVPVLESTTPKQNLRTVVTKLRQGTLQLVYTPREHVPVTGETRP